MEQIFKDPVYKVLVRVVVQPFILEYEGRFQDAITQHNGAVEELNKFVEKFKPRIKKFHRRIFERQMEIHLERKKYLEGLDEKWEGVVVPPTILIADAELVVQNGNQRSLSLDNLELSKCPTFDGAVVKSKAPESIKHLFSSAVPYFTPTLDPSLPPTIYRITHSSELVWLGQRAHWLYVKDETCTHTLWAMHALWSNEEPITVALLRRAGEFLPGAGAVHVGILKTPGGAFKLIMDTASSVITYEVPDRGEKTKYWSPRRFEYGGRKFVWKSEKEKGMLPKFEWESLYETSRVWPKQGSKTGKMEDEVVGDRLAWGEKGGRKGVEHTLYFKAGMDQHFREHLLASQLARFMRCRYPSNNSRGVAAVGAASGLLALVNVLNAL